MPASALANWILACVASPDDRQYVLGDLAEEYAVRRADTSPMSATWWYWTQIVRSIPWLLWSPVSRSGWVPTLGVAGAACVAQAAVELTTAALVPGILQVGGRAAASLTLVVVLGSLAIVSGVAHRLRPGAGTLLALIASVPVLLRALHAGIEGLDGIHLSQVLESVAAPSAALVGAALAVNFPPSRRT